MREESIELGAEEESSALGQLVVGGNPTKMGVG
jgi:hypothetical protein